MPWSLKRQHWPYYKQLMRMDKPIGTFLLLWPTWWALWLASDGIPSVLHLVVFSLGVFVMRSAGCVINDFADRDFDGHVERTQARPLAAGKVSPREALSLFVVLIAIAFALVLLLNLNTILLSFGALALAFCYPFMKRFTQLPQLVLGAAFSFAIPMAFMAVMDTVPVIAWVLFAANVLWTVAYDTMYAMVDKDDDIKIGIKSTAILFGRFDKAIIALLQVLFLILLVAVGLWFESLSSFYWLSVAAATVLSGYQQWLIKDRNKPNCFKAFLNNHYVGMAVFAGIAVSLI